MDYTQRQLAGSEYGGVQPTRATLQPKGPEALTPGDRLKLGYLTGDETDTMSFEDKRQMLGIRPPDGHRPMYLQSAGNPTNSRLISTAENLGFGTPEGPILMEDQDQEIDV